MVISDLPFISDIRIQTWEWNTSVSEQQGSKDSNYINECNEKVICTLIHLLPEKH